MSDLSNDSTIRARLYAGLKPDETTGCLRWTKSHNKGGYGRIGIRQADGTFKIGYVHIVAWVLEHGLVPEGFELDHVKTRGCAYKDCANVEHLEPVTHRVNQQRMGGRTHCRNGHEYTPENTHITPRGNRVCRACRVASVQRWREAHPDGYKALEQAQTRRKKAWLTPPDKIN